MFSGPLNVVMIFFMRESNHPTILETKTKRLKKELGRDDLHSQLEMRLPPREVLARSIVRPVKVSDVIKKGKFRSGSLIEWSQFLFRSPIAFLISLYVSVVYGTLCKLESG